MIVNKHKLDSVFFSKKIITRLFYIRVTFSNFNFEQSGFWFKYKYLENTIKKYF